MKTPVVFGKIATGDAFTDREQEQDHLARNITEGINTILISPRRWGKSSLVAKVAADLSKKHRSLRFCFLDLFNVRTEQDFYAQLAKEVLRVSSSRWEERVESAKQLFKHLVPKFQFGVDPNTDFSVAFEWNEVQKSPEEILNLPELISKRKKIQLVVCIDEFQNIAFFDNPLAFQKRLRAHWQHHSHATYCLYGSKRHLMFDLFENKSMPFYKFGDNMFLEKIPESYWTKFITANFKKTGKRIDDALAQLIAQTMENHPYFVQQLAHTSWSGTEKRCTEKEYHRAVDWLLTQHAILFQREVDNLTNPQLNFLKALCDGVTQFSSVKTLQQFRLGSSGNVNRIKESLLNKEIIDISGTSIEFLDPLFKLWFSTIYMLKS
jgi:hypothetical protein